jgi:hypothetical protein
LEHAPEEAAVWGTLNDTMIATLAPFVRGKVVWDLGSGPEMRHSEILLSLGAQVTAFDKVPLPFVPGVQNVQALFKDIQGHPDVAFLSWPVNNSGLDTLLPLLAQTPVIVYLGSNTDGNACGTLAFFQEIRNRELKAHVPDRHNSLLIVGNPLLERTLTPEEIAALHGRNDIMSWEEAVKRSSEQGSPS